MNVVATRLIFLLGSFASESSRFSSECIHVLIERNDESFLRTTRSTTEFWFSIGSEPLCHYTRSTFSIYVAVLKHIWNMNLQSNYYILLLLQLLDSHPLPSSSPLLAPDNFLFVIDESVSSSFFFASALASSSARLFASSSSDFFLAAASSSAFCWASASSAS